MARKKNTRRNKRTSGTQQLVHTTSAITGASNITNVTVTRLNVLFVRPARPKSIRLTYFSTVPRSFYYSVLNAVAEEIYRSPVILSGPIPRSLAVRFVGGIDFGTYPSDNRLIVFNSVAASTINTTIELTMEYKYPSVPAAELF